MASQAVFNTLYADRRTSYESPPWDIGGFGLQNSIPRHQWVPAHAHHRRRAPDGPVRAACSQVSSSGDCPLNATPGRNRGRAQWVGVCPCRQIAAASWRRCSRQRARAAPQARDRTEQLPAKGGGCVHVGCTPGAGVLFRAPRRAPAAWRPRAVGRSCRQTVRERIHAAKCRRPAAPRWGANPGQWRA